MTTRVGALMVGIALLLSGCTQAQEQTQAQTEAPAAAAEGVEFAPLTLDGLTPRSERPLFARFTVSSDGSRVLSVMLDESEGTGGGYDIAYVDLDFDGTLSPDDRMEAAHSHAREDFAFVGFGPVELQAGYLTGADLTQEVQAQIMYHRMPTWDERGEVTGSEESMMASLSLALTENENAHRYYLGAELPLATTPEEATVVRFDGEVTLTCETLPQDDGTLGVAVVCRIGDVDVYSLEGTVELKITTRDGQLVAEEAGELHDFGFG